MLKLSGGKKLTPAAAQFAQMVPTELTGMNWPLPMYWSSTAEPRLPPMLLVVTVSGNGTTLPK